MTTLTSTELLAAGGYLSFGAAAALENLAAHTVLAYCRPTGSGENGLGYIWSKWPASGNGNRVLINHNAGSPFVSAGANSTSGGGNPQANSAAGTITYNAWQHIAATFDGTLLGTGVKVYIGAGVDLAEASYQSRVDGAGTLSPNDTGRDVWIWNRSTTGRAFVGDGAYVAIWNRVLSLSELVTAQNSGPLSVPSGLVLVCANQADVGPNAYSVAARSTYSAGATPPNTALGGSANATASGATLTGTSSISAGTATGTGNATAPGATLTGSSTLSAGSATGPAITIDDAFERSSINVAGSSVSGSGDAAVITLKPRLQASEVTSGVAKWLHPVARVTGVNGIRPTFKFSDYGNGAGGYWGYPWDAGRKPMFTYDFVTWNYFDTATINATDITFRHGSAFTGDTVYVSRDRSISVTQIGNWLAGLAASYPSLIHNVPSNISGFVSATFSAQTDELGRTVPAQPFLAFKISDASLTPADGNPKRSVVLMCGVHAGEDTHHWVFAGAVEFLLGNNAKALKVRQNCDITIYPMLNPPGRVAGAWRGSFQIGVSGADDLNRHFNDTGCGLEIVTIPRAAMAIDLPPVNQVVIDYHGDWAYPYSTYTNSDANLSAFKTAIESNLGTSLHDYGALPAGPTVSWFHSQGTKHYMSMEVGDPTPITDSALAAYGAATIQAISDLLDAGAILPATAHGATLTGSSTLSAGAASGNASATAPGATLAGTSSLTPGSAGGTGSSTAPGASLAGTGSIAPGAPAAGSTGPGAALAGSSSIAPGSAAGDGTASAPGASLSGASALVAGSASNGITVIAARRRRSVQTSARRPAQLN